MTRTPKLATLLCALLAAPALAADFPKLYNSEPDAAAAPPSPQEALASMKLPPGLAASLFAHEPMVQNPIALTFDSRGRVWVAKNASVRPSALSEPVADK